MFTHILALTFFYLPWLGLNILMFALGRDLTAFYPGILGGLLLLWLMAMCSLAAYPQVPVIWSNLTNFKAFEFLFTRAVDRRLNFRAKAAATLLIVLVPQWLRHSSANAANGLLIEVTPQAVILRRWLKDVRCSG